MNPGSVFAVGLMRQRNVPSSRHSQRQSLPLLRDTYAHDGFDFLGRDLDAGATCRSPNSV
jgi:hypothetical protein